MNSASRVTVGFCFRMFAFPVVLESTELFSSLFSPCLRVNRVSIKGISFS